MLKYMIKNNLHYSDLTLAQKRLFWESEVAIAQTASASIKSISQFVDCQSVLDTANTNLRAVEAGKAGLECYIQGQSDDKSDHTRGLAMNFSDLIDTLKSEKDNMDAVVKYIVDAASDNIFEYGPSLDALDDLQPHIDALQSAGVEFDLERVVYHASHELTH